MLEINGKTNKKIEILNFNKNYNFKYLENLYTSKRNNFITFFNNVI